MPPFPGLGYPLVPGYEAVGRVAVADDTGRIAAGSRVFVPGSSGFSEARGLFGASASDLLVTADRLAPLPDCITDEDAVLLALAATAHHAIGIGSALPELVIGHGVLGRLVARITVALGGRPTVWETQSARRGGADGYAVVDPAEDERRDYASALDVSGDSAILDQLMPRLARRGEIVLAGFYKQPVAFAFPPAFMREAQIRIAAEWRPDDMAAVIRLVETGRLSLSGIATHRGRPGAADAAYRTAFEDADCLKMIMDWRA